MANSDDRYEMLRDRELSKLSWVVKEFFAGSDRRSSSVWKKRQGKERREGGDREVA